MAWGSIKRRRCCPNSPDVPGRLIVITGPSGSGKSTIIQALLQKTDVQFSISATTRSRRPDEKDQVDYLFVSPQEFQEMVDNDQLLEWASFNDRLYGTPAEPVKRRMAEGQDVLLDIEVQGARQIREKYPEALMIFISPPSIEELERRLRQRGDTSASDIQDRLEMAIALDVSSDLFDHIVVNEVVGSAIAEVVDLVTG